MNTHHHVRSVRHPVRAGVLAGLLSCLCAAHAADAPPAVAGPFTVGTELRKISTGAFPNISGNPFSRMTVSDFRVSYRGRKVEVTDGKNRFHSFWDARVLAGAPRPAVLAMIRGVYLLSEQDGALHTEVLIPDSSDMARWQWLDSDNGQPGPEYRASIRDGREDPRELSGGRLLMFNSRVVLDVAALKSYDMQVNTHDNVRALDDYNAYGSPVKMLSPGRTQYVLVGSRYVDQMFEYALVVVDYARGHLYALPFDSNRTRFESVWDATPQWIGHYFEWVRDQGGSELLRPRADAKPMPWQGRYSGGQRDNLEYLVRPVKPEALKAFTEFLQREFDAVKIEETANSASLRIGDGVVKLYYRDEERYLGLYPATAPSREPAADALIRRIGQRFNEELAAERQQAIFATFVQHR